MKLATTTIEVRTLRPGLVNVTAPITRWPVDWETLERRRTAETSQLEVMQKYAYTDRCRRAFVLRYFGDPAATNSCEQCDNCLHLGHAATSSAAGAELSAGRRATIKKTKAAKNDAVAADFTDDEQQLLDKLRTLRTELSKRDKVPAYVVFADRTLREMARAKPRTPGALGDVHGVGPAKMEKYGEEFLDIIRHG